MPLRFLRPGLSFLARLRDVFGVPADLSSPRWSAAISKFIFVFLQRRFSENPVDYGAVADARTIKDFGWVSGTSTITSATALFGASDVGKTIRVNGAGAAGAILTATIAAVVNPATVTVAGGVVAATTVAGAIGAIGTDNAAAIAAAFAKAKETGGVRRIVFPAGKFLTETITAPEGNMIVTGAGSGTDDDPLVITGADRNSGTELISKSGDDIFRVTGGSNRALRVSDICFRGAGHTTKRPAGDRGGCGIYIHDMSTAGQRVVIENLYVIFHGGCGIRIGTYGVVTDSENNTFYSSILRNISVGACGDQGISVWSWGPSGRVDTIWGFVPSAVGTMTDDGRGYCFHVENGHFDGDALNFDTIGPEAKYPAERGGFVYFGSGVRCKISTMTLENPWGDGAYIKGTATIDNLEASVSGQVPGHIPSVAIYVAEYSPYGGVVVNGSKFLTNVRGWTESPIHVANIGVPFLVRTGDHPSYPTTYYDRGAGVHRSLKALRPMGGSNGSWVWGFDESRSLLARNDATISAGGETGGFYYADLGWGSFRDDNATVSGQYDLVTKGAGSGTRNFIWYDTTTGDKRYGFVIGNVTGSTIATSYGQFFNCRIAQSGGASYVAQFVNVIEDGVGGGTKTLAQWRVGGVDRFNCDSLGNVAIGGSITSAGSPVLLASDLSAHANDTTAIHGISDTSQVAMKNVAGTFSAEQVFPSIGIGAAVTDGFDFDIKVAGDAKLRIGSTSGNQAQAYLDGGAGGFGQLFSANGSFYITNGAVGENLVLRTDGGVPQLTISGISGTFANGLIVNGTATLGSGSTALAAIYSSVAAIDFGSIAAHSSDSSQTVNVTGATVGSTVIVTPPATFPPNVEISGVVSSAGVVTLTVDNNDDAAADPPSGNYRVTVIRF